MHRPRRGVRVVSPTYWTATAGAHSENLTFLFERDSSISYVRVRPSAPSGAVQFLTALRTGEDVGVERACGSIAAISVPERGAACYTPPRREAT